MLLNFTNHPSGQWKENQRQAATETFGTVVDMDFPAIDPLWHTKKVEQLAKRYTEDILAKISDKKRDAVLIMGEQSFCVALVSKLQKKGISCYAATTQREVETYEARKISMFKFVQFRKYPLCI